MSLPGSSTEGGESHPTCLAEALKHIPLTSLATVMPVIQDLPDSCLWPTQDPVMDILGEDLVLDESFPVDTLVQSVKLVDLGHIRVRPMPTRPDVDVVEVVADQMPARPPLAQHLLDQCKRQLDHVGWGDGYLVDELVLDQEPKRLIHDYYTTLEKYAQRKQEKQTVIPDAMDTMPAPPEEEKVSNDSEQVMQTSHVEQPQQTTSHRKPTRVYHQHEIQQVSLPLQQYLEQVFRQHDVLVASESGMKDVDLFKQIGSEQQWVLDVQTIHRLDLLLSRAAKCGALDVYPVVDLVRLEGLLDTVISVVEANMMTDTSTTLPDDATSDSDDPMEGLESDVDHRPECNTSGSQAHDLLVKEQCMLAKHGIEASICALRLMTGGQLTRQLYPEDLILGIVRLSRCIQMQLLSKIDEHLEDAESLLTSFGQCLQQLARLMDEHEMSEQVVILSIYLALGLVLYTSKSDTTSKRMERIINYIRMPCLELLCRIFYRYVNQRAWLLDEILALAGSQSSDEQASRPQYWLTDGTTVDLFTVLLLRLIQGVGMQFDDDTGRPTDTTMSEASQSSVVPPFLIELDQVCDHTFKETEHIAMICAAHLVSRGANARSSTTTIGFRKLIDIFVGDLLCMLYHVEWPASSLALVALGKQLAAHLDNADVDLGFKSLAIENIGRIYAEMSKSVETTDEVIMADAQESSCTLSLDEITSIDMALQVVLGYYHENIANDHALKQARRLFVSIQRRALPMTEEIFGIKASTMMETQPVSAKYTTVSDAGKDALLRVMKTLWQAVCASNPLERSTTHNVPDHAAACQAMSTIAHRMTLQGNLDVFIDRLIASLELSAASMRAKALKTLGGIVGSSLSKKAETKQVYDAIATRLYDHAVSVRDAATDVIGHLILSNLDLVQVFYPKLRERVIDTGLIVRKRTMRLLSELYRVSSDVDLRVDIAQRLLGRTLDLDASVRSLATKYLGELWFSPLPSQNEQGSAALYRTTGFQQHYEELHSLPALDIKELQARLNVIANVCRHLGNETNHFTLFIRSQLDMTRMRNVVMRLCYFYAECIFEKLHEADSTEDNHLEGYAAMLAHFSKAMPELFFYNLPSLRVYLKDPTANEGRLLPHILYTFSNVLPFIKHPDRRFMLSLQLDLTILLTKSSQVVTALAVACLCLVIDKYTQQRAHLYRLFTVCFCKLEEEYKRYIDHGEFSSIRNVLRLVLILGQICLHFDLDAHRHNIQDSVYQARFSNQTSLVDNTFALLVKFVDTLFDPVVQGFAMKSIGYIYQVRPKLLTSHESRTIITRILSSQDTAVRVQLLQVFLALLQHDQRDAAPTEEEELEERRRFGHTLNFRPGDEGIGPALMQTYIGAVLRAVSETDVALHETAFEVIRQTLQQGIVHPLRCIPSVVLSMISPVQKVQQRAVDLFSAMELKHPSLVYTRMADCIQATVDFRQRLVPTADAPLGILEYTAQTQEATLASFYSFVRHKKARRIEFIQHLLKPYETITSEGIPPTTLSLCRFAAENLAVLPYGSPEELLTVVTEIDRIVADYGAPLLSLNDEHDDHVTTPEALAYQSLSMLLLAKRHLYARFCIALKSATQAFKECHVCFSWDTVVFDVRTERECAEQLSQFRRLLEEDSKLDAGFKQLEQLGKSVSRSHSSRANATRTGLASRSPTRNRPNPSRRRRRRRSIDQSDSDSDEGWIAETSTEDEDNTSTDSLTDSDDDDLMSSD